MSRHDDDAMILDPDSEWQDSAQAIIHETSPRIPRDRSPLSLGSLLLAVVIVCLCAAAVIVACDAVAADVYCMWSACA